MENILRNTLRANAAFSFLCAIFLLVFTKTLQQTMGIDGIYLQMTGVALAGFVVLLLFVSENKSISIQIASMITIADWGWVVGSAGLLIIANSYFTMSGNVIISVVAVIVALCAYFQGKEISQIKAQS